MKFRIKETGEIRELTYRPVDEYGETDWNAETDNHTVFDGLERDGADDEGRPIFALEVAEWLAEYLEAHRAYDIRFAELARIHGVDEVKGRLEIMDPTFAFDDLLVDARRALDEAFAGEEAAAPA
jgi:hypothetical protein